MVLMQPVVPVPPQSKKQIMYINCHSYHSLRYGTIPLNELVQQAASCGVQWH
jgi:hypothetical protein